MLITSSTGGPTALLTVLEGLSPSVTAPILIAQHMPPAFTAALAENIEKKCGRPSGEGKDGEILEPGHVYVAPGDKHMVLEQDGDAVRVRINDDPPENFCRPSADPLFRSAAGIFGAKILVTVLTGMGSDGEAGSRKIAEAGGTVITQNEETSVVWGMPRAVAQAGLCSHVLPLPQIASRLNKLAGANKGPEKALLAVGLNPVIPGREQRKRRPQQDDQRQPSAGEVGELVMPRSHHQKVGLITQRRGEGTVGSEDHGDSEDMRLHPQLYRQVDGDRRE